MYKQGVSMGNIRASEYSYSDFKRGYSDAYASYIALSREIKTNISFIDFLVNYDNYSAMPDGSSPYNPDLYFYPAESKGHHRKKHKHFNKRRRFIQKIKKGILL